MPEETHKATCYLLVGGADGALDVSLRASNGRIAQLGIIAPSGFGGMIWQVVSQMLIDAPLQPDALQARVVRMTQSGLLPEELNLDPLIKTLLKLAAE